MFSRKNSGFSLIEALLAIFISSVIITSIIKTENHISATTKLLETKQNTEYSAREILQELGNDFEQIILINENQPILESHTTKNTTKICFISVNPKFHDNTTNHETTAILYIFSQQKSNIFIEKRTLSLKNSIFMQADLTDDSSLITEFEKFDNSSKKYKTPIKNFTIFLESHNDNDEDFQLFDLKKSSTILKNTLFSENKEYFINKMYISCSLDISDAKPSKKFQNIENQTSENTKTFHKTSIIRSVFLN